MRPIVNATTLLLSTLLASPPAAAAEPGAFDEVARRADCAQLELAKELGERVKPDELAACKERVRKTLARRQEAKGKKASKDGYFEVKSPESMPLATSRPDWLKGKRSTSSLIFGVGLVERGEAKEGDVRRVAAQRAIVEIAAQLQTQIDSVSVIKQSADMVSVTGPDGKTRQASTDAQSISSTSRLLVQNCVDNIKFQEFYQDPKGIFYLLAALDVEEIARQQDAVALAVLESLAQVADSVLAAFEGNNLTQEVIFELADAVEQAGDVGRTPMGKKVKDRWKEPVKKLERLGKHLVSCIEVKGGATDPANVELTVSCMERPIRHGKFIAQIDGGIVDVPATLLTDAEGGLKFKIGTVYGHEHVKVTLAHDLADSRAAALFGDSKPAQTATFELAAAEVPKGTLKIVGLPSGATGGAQLFEVVSGFVERKLGIEIAEAGSLKVIATVTMGTKTPVGARFSVPVDLDVTVTSPRGKLFKKSVRTAGLADSEYAAQQQALQRAVDAMRTW
jgi:hypothetical protein